MLISRNADKIIFFISLFLVIIPKINLVSFSGESAGLRIDDFIIFSFLGVFLVAFIKRGLVTNFDGYIYFIFFSLVSIGFCYLIDSAGGSFLYPIRFIEYLFFYIVGRYCIHQENFNKQLMLIFIVNALVMIFQYLGFIGGFASAGYDSDISSRVIGLTGGPWEIGFLINIIFCCYVFGCQLRKTKIITFFIFSFIFVIATGARMPTLTHLLLFSVYLFLSSKNKFLSFLTVSLILIVLVVFMINVDNPVSERSAKLFSINNYTTLLEFYDKVIITVPFHDFPPFPINNSSDLSWLMRVAKWSYAVKQWSLSDITILIGLGSGYWGPALDGGWLRILTENGIIGLSLFLMALLNFSKNHIVCKLIIIAFSVNMLMIDLYLSYKSMALLLLCMGFYKSKNNFIFKREVK